MILCEDTPRNKLARNARRRETSFSLHPAHGAFDARIETPPSPGVASVVSPKRRATPHLLPSDTHTPKHLETAESTQFASRRRTELSAGRRPKAALSSRPWRPPNRPSNVRTPPWKRGLCTLGNGVFSCAASSLPLRRPRRSIPSPARCGHFGFSCEDAAKSARRVVDFSVPSRSIKDRWRTACLAILLTSSTLLSGSSLLPNAFDTTRRDEHIVSAAVSRSFAAPCSPPTTWTLSARSCAPSLV